MTQKIKDFFTQKRCKSLLKNNRGFSLLEVLIAVAIIGIISAIAIPGFKSNLKSAATVAGSTSIANIQKSYKSCITLKSFTDCDSLGDLAVDCNDCVEQNNNSNKFCIFVTKTASGKTMNACFSVDNSGGNGAITTTMGGTLLAGVKYCHEQKGSGCPGSCAWDTATVRNPLKTCTANSDCVPTGYTAASTPSSNDDVKKDVCQTTTKTGKCQSNACI